MVASRPRVYSVLYLRECSNKASPKAISGRTSYLRVRLEFLRYPHLIRHFFNRGRFGPPLGFTPTSSWTWIGHPVSGLRLLTCAQLKLGFPAAPGLKPLALPAHAARRTVLQKVRGHTCEVLPQLAGTAFQVLFHSPPGVLFTFPSQYCFAIGHQVVFRLGGWSPRLPTGFLVSRGTLDPAGFTSLSSTWLSHSVAGLPMPFD